MKIFIAIWDDHHADASVHAFSDKDEAIAWAKEKVREQLRDTWELNEELTQGMERAGWIYYGRYSCEGDSIRVVTVELDKP